MKNWLEIAVAVYLLGMVLYGHWRGAIRLAVSAGALLVTLTAVHFAMPYVTSFLRDNTPVHGWVMEKIEDVLDESKLGAAIGMETEEEEAEAQLQVIEEMKLPDEIKELLIRNNKRDVYDLLGVDAFKEYVGDYLASIIINCMGYVILCIAVFVAMKLVAGALDLVAKLPVVSGVNQLAGAVLGGLVGLVFLWLAALAVTACSAMSWTEPILEQINASPWLSFLYRYNLISKLALGILEGIFS